MSVNSTSLPASANTDPVRIAQDLGAAALAKDPKLNDFSGFVQDSGEGGWNIGAALEEAVPLAADAHLRRKDALGHALWLR